MVARMVVEAVHHLLNYTFLSTKSQVFSMFRLGKQRRKAPLHSLFSVDLPVMSRPIRLNPPPTPAPTARYWLPR